MPVLLDTAQVYPLCFQSMQDAAAKLRAWRIDHDYTLEDAGRFVGCCFTTISKIEHRWQHPGLGLAFRIEKLLSIPAATWAKSKLLPEEVRMRARRARAKAAKSSAGAA